jgi:hypothetical protein
MIGTWVLDTIRPPIELTSTPEGTSPPSWHSGPLSPYEMDADNLVGARSDLVRHHNREGPRNWTHYPSGRLRGLPDGCQTSLHGPPLHVSPGLPERTLYVSADLRLAVDSVHCGVTGEGQAIWAVLSAILLVGFLSCSVRAVRPSWERSDVLLWPLGSGVGHNVRRHPSLACFSVR